MLKNMSFVKTKPFSSLSAKVNDIRKVVIVGGDLGSGIAQVAAQAGNEVTLVDSDLNTLKKAENSISKSLQRIAKKVYKENSNEENFIRETIARIKTSTDAVASVKDAELVIEVIAEDMSMKHDLFKKLDVAAPQKTIFTSCSSSLGIAQIASVTNRKDRFGGLHFFVPVPVMKLLEVVKTEDTSDQTFDDLWQWGKSIGKSCVKCKDTPGYIVNRLLVPYILEAIKMVERGDANVEDIDTAMKLGAGYPMGPLEVADYIGLDTIKFILDEWFRKFPDNPLFQPVTTVDRFVKEGKLGKKTGQGFYKYN